MRKNIFSSVISITNGLHRDNRIEREFQALLSKLKLEPTASNAVFKVNYKKAFNSKKEYYQRLIFNESEGTLADFASHFPENSTLSLHDALPIFLHNKLDKHAKDISKYIAKREIPEDLNDDTYYIINYLKVSIIRLYAELQEQYGQFSNSTLYTIPEIAEKYFDDSNFNTDLIQKAHTPKEVTVKPTTKPQRKTKTSFGYKNRDTAKLLSVLNQLQLKIDLLQNKNTVEELHKLLLAGDYTQINSKIYIECETTQFSYIVSKLKPFFLNFHPTSIERSEKFLSKTGTVFKANNLHKNRIDNPKGKDEIDNRLFIGFGYNDIPGSILNSSVSKRSPTLIENLSVDMLSSTEASTLKL